jgi:hypothetical protein
MVLTSSTGRSIRRGSKYAYRMGRSANRFAGHGVVVFATGNGLTVEVATASLNRHAPG